MLVHLHLDCSKQAPTKFRWQLRDPRLDVEMFNANENCFVNLPTGLLVSRRFRSNPTSIQILGLVRLIFFHTDTEPLVQS